MCPGHGDKSGTPKCLSEIPSRTCTEYNVLLFQETGKGTAVLLSEFLERLALCRGALIKVTCVNANADHHVGLPGALTSKWYGG